MPSNLVHNAYGKSAVRLTKVVRGADRHELFEMSVNLFLQGDFAESYVTGDNTNVIATDSMKNTVYVLAKERDFDNIDAFSAELARHFVDTYPQVSTASIEIEQTGWQRAEVAGELHPIAFIGGSSERRICRTQIDRSPAQVIRVGGVRGLVVLKTTDSEFRDFVTDRFRTLKDTRDRIFATTVNAEWTFVDSGDIDFNACHAQIRAAMIATFAGHHSLAVQQTLLAMGEAALAVCPQIGRIHLEMPNQHRIPFNLQPFGLENSNDIFVPTDEPYGLIVGTVERGK